MFKFDVMTSLTYIYISMTPSQNLVELTSLFCNNITKQNSSVRYKVNGLVLSY